MNKTWGWYKYRYFIMGLKIKDYMFETSRYRYKSTYDHHGNCTSKIYHRYTKTRQKEHKHTIKDNNQNTRTKDEKKDKTAKKNYKNNQKTSNKILININIYLSIITLKVSGLNPLIKRHGVADWIKNKTHLYAACKKKTQKNSL